MTDDVAATAPLEKAMVDAMPLQKARVGLAGAQLKRLAQSGGFAVDDTTGNQMIEALEGVIDTLAARWAALQRLKASPALSGTPTGQWVAGHMVATAADEKGLLTQLEQARAEFPTYVEAIKLAKQNYRAREQGTTADLTAIHRVERS